QHRRWAGASSRDRRAHRRGTGRTADDTIPIRNYRSGSSSCSRQPERSEEHTSELQSRFDLVCRLLLEKKKTVCNALAWGGLIAGLVITFARPLGAFGGV